MTTNPFKGIQINTPTISEIVRILTQDEEEASKIGAEPTKPTAKSVWAIQDHRNNALNHARLLHEGLSTSVRQLVEDAGIIYDFLYPEDD